jgi:hypothetical protein
MNCSDSKGKKQKHPFESFQTGVFQVYPHEKDEGGGKS